MSVSDIQQQLRGQTERANCFPAFLHSPAVHDYFCLKPDLEIKCKTRFDFILRVRESLHAQNQFDLQFECFFGQYFPMFSHLLQLI